LLFDHCAKCQSCCNVDAGFGTLEITLTQQETKVFRHLCIEDQCEHLGDKGCSLGDRKPLSCQLYPLSFDPQLKKYYFDAACPLLPEYKRQLKDSGSDASNHFREMNTRIEEMAVIDPKFLSRNHEIDLDFFELVPLRQPSHLKKPHHER
jgi:Fe-S-cluster containining protein